MLQLQNQKMQSQSGTITKIKNLFNKNQNNKIMSSLNKSFSTPQRQNPQQNRLYDHLQNIYNSDANQNKQQAKFHKQLYAKLIEQNEKRLQQKKYLQKKINNYQNQQIDIFWKNREQQLRDRQKRQRKQIQQARNINQNLHGQKVLSKSMVIPCDVQQNHKQHFDNMLINQYRINQKKQINTKFLQQGQAYNDYKHYQQQLQRQRLIQAEKKKLRQNDQIQHKRLEQLDKWRKKYLQSHNKQAFQIWDKARRSREIQQDALDNYIVFQGARQLNQRTSKMKNQIFQRQHQKRNRYINELHSQLQNNEYRTANDSKLQKQYQRKIIEQRNQYLNFKDKLVKQQMNQQHKQHLNVLKSQLKPRILLPQVEKLQFPGLGSPVHIGKAMADDRRKQLQYIQKNLYKQLKL